MRFSAGKNLLLAATGLLAFSGSANASIMLSTTPGTNPYSGPTPPTYTFEAATPQVTGGLITTGNSPGVRAQPYGSTGNYWTVGPSDGTPGVLNLSSFGDIGSISFIWGSVDTYNTLEVLNAANAVIGTFTGANVSALANGNQTDPFTNPLVTLTFSGADITAVNSLRLSSTQNAFETDNFTIRAPVPEPSTWAMMLVGFGAIGFGMRRRRAVRIGWQAA